MTSTDRFGAGELDRPAPHRPHDFCYSSVLEKNPARSSLPIELSSIVSSLETVTRELTRKLSSAETEDVIADLCERLKRIPEDRRGAERPFTR